VSPLRVGYTCHDAFPSTGTNTQQIFWTLSEMARLGHQIDLCVPALDGGARARERVAHHYGTPDTGVPDRLQFVSLDTSARTALAKAWFDLRAPWRFNRRTHDVLWTRDPLALVSAVRSGLPVVFETYRPDFASARAFAPWRRAALRGGQRSGREPRRLAGVITHSELARDAFVRAGVPEERCLTAHNGYAPTLMEPALSRTEARRRTRLPDDRPLIVYAGHVGAEKGSDALVAIAAAVPEMSVVIVGVQDATERRWLERCAARAGATNLVLVPRVGLREVSTYLYAADCLIVPPTDAPLNRYGRTVLPMKLFSYLAAGRPILAPDLADMREVLTNGRTAVLVPPGDPVAAARALRELVSDTTRADALAEAAKAASRALTWSTRARTIASAIEGWI
jgi:glycosyltransferase involved in cell wall biosynthesis